MVAQGTTLAARYRLDSRIGAGGMGEVWRGEDTVLARTVAVKVLLPGRSDDPGFLVRFQGEARAMATINHPGVVEVYDYGIHEVPGVGATAYLVMKFVDGEPLDRLLGRLGSIAPTPAMDLIAQAASALQVVHEQGIVHRDIKPGNFLVRSDGTLVLIDFGIARSDAASRLTDAGMVLGTAAYCAPEQAEGAPVTPAVDIYALGVVAYECLAGRRPFEGDTPVSVALKHIREMPPPLPQHIPPAVRALVEQALAKDPARRFPSAMAMSAAARQSILGLDPGASTGLPQASAESAGETGRQAAQTGWQGQTPGVAAQTGWQPSAGAQTGWQTAAEAQTGWQGSVATQTGPQGGGPATPSTGPAIEAVPSGHGRRAAKKPRRKGALMAVFAAAGVMCVGLVAVALNGSAASTPDDAGTPTAPPSASGPSGSPSRPTQKRLVPNVIGMPLEGATARLKKAGLKADTPEGVDLGDARCTKVVKQNPLAGIRWDPKQPVTIVVEACSEQSAEPSPEPTAEPTSTPALAFPAPPTGKMGSPYRVTLTVKGGTEPYAWALSTGSLPPGLDLKATGLLSGTPTKAGKYPFTVQVTDADDLSATQEVTLVIASKPTPTSTPVLKKVPSVKDLPQKEAETRLTAAGLKWKVSDASGGEQSPCMRVVEQDPAADTMWDTRKPVEISVISVPCPSTPTPTPKPSS